MPDCEENDSHPIRRDWAEYKKTVEFTTLNMLHNEDAMFDGFRDGWLYGRTHRAKINTEEDK